MSSKRIYGALAIIVLIIISAGCTGKGRSNKEQIQNAATDSTKITLATPFKFNDKKTVAYVKGLQAEDEFPISVTNALYYTYGMEALSVDITSVQKKRLTDFIVRSQKSDGGFAFDKANSSDPYNTYCAVWTLKKINALDKISVSKVEGYIKSLENKDGGFAYPHGQASQPISTYYCLASLKVLEKLANIDKQKVVDYLKAVRAKDGGFALRPGIPANAQSTFAALQSLRMLDSLNVADKDKAIAYLVKDQSKRDGGFSYMAGEQSMSLPENTYYAVSSLHLLGALDKINVKQLSKFMSDHYDDDGGFTDVYYGNTKYLSTFYGIATLVELGYFKNPETEK